MAEDVELSGTGRGTVPAARPDQRVRASDRFGVAGCARPAATATTPGPTARIRASLC